MSRARIKAIIRQFVENGVKLLLEDPANVRELLAIADLAMLNQIDFDHMIRVRTSFVLRDYRRLRLGPAPHSGTPHPPRRIPGGAPPCGRAPGDHGHRRAPTLA